LQPSAGVEWVIHNLLWAGAAEVYFYDGTNTIKIFVDTTFGGLMGTVFHCTNSTYYRIKNVTAGAIYCGYDGMVTK
jgi:hypothetical protein